MIAPDDLQVGLDSFLEQFAAQVANAGAPESEHAVHFCLALGIQAALGLPLGSIVFERRLGSKRIDLWIAPYDMAIEVKFRRPIPSGRNLPATQLFGDLLADLNKVAYADAQSRLVVFVSDKGGVTYLRDTAHGLLPLRRLETKSITPAHIQRLPKTAAGRAEADGPWVPLSAELVWSEECGSWHLLAWRVEPLKAG
jgi:hypothetical protein